MTVSVSANIHFNEDDVWHRWHPGDDLCHAYGALKFGEGATLFFDRPAQIDKVIAELVALRAEMTGEAVVEFTSDSRLTSARCLQPGEHGPNLAGAVIDCDIAAHHEAAAVSA